MSLKRFRTSRLAQHTATRSRARLLANVRVQEPWIPAHTCHGIAANNRITSLGLGAPVFGPSKENEDGSFTRFSQIPAGMNFEQAQVAVASRRFDQRANT